VTAGLRALSGKRVKPQVRIREREQLVLALFDMEGTILPSNVVESYVWSRMADLPWDQWPDELASVFSRIPSYLMADRRDRGEFLRTFFRRTRARRSRASSASSRRSCPSSCCRRSRRRRSAGSEITGPPAIER
jgi:hypothetical protein